MQKINSIFVLTLLVCLCSATVLKKATLVDDPTTPHLPAEPFNYDIPFTDFIMANVLWVNQNA